MQIEMIALVVGAVLAAQPAAQGPAADAHGDETSAAAKWVRERAVVLDADEAGSGFEDLAPLKQMVGGARIVSLGEPTHGTRECFQMKHRLLEFLASEMGFTIFSIEASLPEAFRLNEYVLQGRGDPAELIRGMHFWTWSTQEVLAMVEWMRAFNERRGDRGPVRFTGFDMQYTEAAMQNVRTFVAVHDENMLAEIDAAWAKVAEAERAQAAAAGGSPFAVATGSFPAGAARGKRVRFSGFLKTEGVGGAGMGGGGFAALWWRADGPDGEVLAFDNMQDRGPRGDTGWAHYAIELDVPEATVNISYGLILNGSGTAWFDGLKVELDGKEHDGGGAVDGGIDLGFESPRKRGLAAMVMGAEAALDREQFIEGEQSLRLTRNAAMAQAGGAAGAGQAARTLNESLRAAQDVIRRLEAAREKLATAGGKEQAEWAIRNARVVLQALQAKLDPSRRDPSMAENVAWILEQHPGARIVLWSHNAHASMNPGWMGSFLEQKFGDEHITIGFATAEGAYTAVGPNGLTAYPLHEPPAQSVEAILNAAGPDRFILDLRGAEAGTDASGWVLQERPCRMIGALAMEEQFHPDMVGRAFDLLIFQRRTSAAVQLPRGKTRE